MQIGILDDRDYNFILNLVLVKSKGKRFDCVHILLSAPAVILDIGKLPTQPTRTQCPECMEFVTTETFTSVSSVTWLVCFMSAMIGYELSLPFGLAVKYLPNDTVTPCCTCFCLLSHFQVCCYQLVLFLLSRFSAAWLVAASFLSAWTGSRPPRTDVQSVGRKSQSSKSSERRS